MPCGFSTTGGGGGAGAGARGGVDAHDASHTATASNATRVWRIASVPDANHQPVDVCGLELLAHLVQLLEVADGPDTHAMPDIVVDGDALNLRVDSLQFQLRGDSLRIRLVAVRACLQHIDAGPLDARGAGHV